MGATMRVLICDDHPMVRAAIAMAVTTAFGLSDIHESASLEELLAQLKTTAHADIALLDLKLPDVDGFSGLLQVREAAPSVRVVIISALADTRLVNEALALGAAGFIPKSTPREQVVEALRAVAAGEKFVPAGLPAPPPSEAKQSALDPEIAARIATLTAQQRKVLQLLGTGKLNKEIAYELDIVETTVKAHVSAILRKMHVYSRTQAVVLASRIHMHDFEGIAEVPDYDRSGQEL